MPSNKTCLLAIAVFLLFCNNCRSQNALPVLLKEPAGWTFEKFSLPPVFAPSFPFQGFEELRFSPGMFTKNAADYFSYAFAAALDNKTDFTRADLGSYLERYFKGLCFSTARDRKLTIDTSKITVSLKETKSLYLATLQVFGVFADGAPLTLNMEIKTQADKTASKVYLIFIASPKPKEDAIWTQLHVIRDGFKPPPD